MRKPVTVEDNEQLFAHPTIQCGQPRGVGPATVGLVGILNGIFGIKEEDGWGYIYAELDGEGPTCLRFGVGE